MERPMSTTVSLEQVRIASPCSMKWDDLSPVRDGATVRHCGQCRLNVYNLSGMTREEAEAVVGEAEGRLCVGFFRRADGTMLTRDCPVGLRAARARVVRVVGWCAAAAGFVLTGAALAGARTRCDDDLRVGELRPFSTIRAWLTPARQQKMYLGGAIVLPFTPGRS